MSETPHDNAPQNVKKGERFGGLPVSDGKGFMVHPTFRVMTYCCMM